MDSKLFSPLQIREIRFRNRIFVSPMCTYSSVEGVPQPWHLVHLGSRAVGGAALVMAEATAVSPEGRVSPDDSGIWNDTQAEAFRPITEFIRGQGAVSGVQLAHAGRKASTVAPWNGGGPMGGSVSGWIPLAPSAIPFAPDFPVPKEATGDEIEEVVTLFGKAARNAMKAGFEVVEIHMAHGYLLHQFLSPLSNRRADEYGGAFENRVRLPLRVAQEVRNIWPERQPVFVRISATDWVDGGWDLPQSVKLAKQLREFGIDLVDCSSGGLVHNAKVPAGPGFQVPFAEAIRRDAGVATAAVGFITDPRQAEAIIAEGKADSVFMAREMLRDLYWPLHAAKVLEADVSWPKQYLRAK